MALDFQADGEDLGHHVFEVNSSVTVLMDIDSPLPVPQGCPDIVCDGAAADDDASLLNDYLDDLSAFPEDMDPMADAEAAGSDDSGSGTPKSRDPWEPCAKTGSTSEKVRVRAGFAGSFFIA